MQTVLNYLMLLVTGLVMQGQNNVEVSITKFDNNEGVVMVGLYSEEGQFLNKTFMSLTSEISEKEAVVTFTDVPAGSYAISCFHDEDSNGQLNMRMGMFPSEPYGCSNGAKGFFGPPKWEDAVFEVKEGETMSVDIRL